MSHYKKIYKKTLRYSRHFKKFLDAIEKEPNSKKKIEIAKEAAGYASSNNPGCFYSKFLENTFTDYAKKHDIDDYNISYQKNTFLHVMTVALTWGGHTRVTERWIEQSPKDQIHTVILLSQGDNPIPERLIKAVSSKNGQLIIIDQNKSDLEKALKLRKLGLEYEYIILNVSASDIIPIIAFGTNKFTRPVILFNQGSHVFWIGTSIVDKLIDVYTLRSVTNRRGIKNISKLNIPYDNKKTILLNKEESRQILNIPKDVKLILTIGHPYKYTPYNNCSYTEILTKITSTLENTICIAIGPSNKLKEWKKVNRMTNGKINAIGYADYEKEYFNYIAASDLILDSWPMGGATSLVDAISQNKPVLSLKNILQADYIVNSEANCETEEELIQKTNKVINNDEYRNLLLNNIIEELNNDNSEQNWSDNLQQIIQDMPKLHNVIHYDNIVNEFIYDDYILIINQILHYELHNRSLYKKIRHAVGHYLPIQVIMSLKKILSI